MNIYQKDRDILRRLATKYAGIAAQSIHKQTIHHWQRINALDPVKPMVSIDQICWHEMNVNAELTLLCENKFCRDMEWTLRSTIYKWVHFPCDMVVMPYFEISKSIGNSGYGIDVKYEDGGAAESHQHAQTHIFKDQIPDEAALDKIQNPIITYDEKTTLRNKSIAEDIFGDILPVKMTGVSPGFRVWDELAFFRGVTPILFDFTDRPEFLHAVMEKFTNIHLDLLRQYEKLNILEKDASSIHCSATFTDELPAKDFDGVNVRGLDCWAYGMGQIFSSCSPMMFDEFEIEYSKRYYEHCGLVNYGCCEPLHDKVHLIRKMHGVRKISTSAWADVNVMARNIGHDYVLLRKPNPAFVASNTLDEQSIRKEICATLAACKEYGTPCEFILKDITTVNNQPERLTRWAQIINEEIEKAQQQ